MERRHLYAIADTETCELLGTFAGMSDASPVLKKMQAGQETSISMFNITHGGTPRWIVDAAVEAHARSSPDAEVRMNERVVRISSSYELSGKASSLMLEQFAWIPDLDDHLESVPGFISSQVDAADPDKVIVTVEMDVAEGGDRTDPSRRGSFHALDRLLLDISRYRWHMSPEARDDAFLAPVHTTADYIFTVDRRTSAVSLNWSETDQFFAIDVTDKKTLRCLAKPHDTRNAELIRKYAIQQMQEGCPSLRP